MANRLRILLYGAVLSLSACSTHAPEHVAEAPSTYSYTDPSVSGLRAANPFPGPDDVCMSLSANTFTRPFEKENHFLIACPKHEIGAIEDRISQQKAAVVGNAKHWVVMRVSNS